MSRWASHIILHGANRVYHLPNQVTPRFQNILKFLQRMQFKPKHIQRQLTLLQNSKIHSLQCVFEDPVVTMKCRSELVPRQILLNRNLLPHPSLIIQLFVHSYIQPTNIHWTSTTCLCITLGHMVLETNINTIREPEYWPIGAQRGSPQHFPGTWRTWGKKY